MAIVAPPDSDLLLSRLKALADEKRLRIVRHLAGGERCVCELQEEVDAGQSLLSFHLKALRDAGIVTDRREGRWVYYSLDPEALAGLAGFLGEVGQSANGNPVRSARCD